MSLQFFAIKQVFTTDRTSPILVLSHESHLGTLAPVRFAIPGLAFMPVILQFRVIRGCLTPYLDVPFNGNVAQLN